MQATGKRLRVSADIVKPTDALIERFLAKVNKEGPTPDQENPHYIGLGRCWDWEGLIGPGGYGMTQKEDKASGSVVAHRMSFRIHVGPIPEGALILHRCDRRCCVNPNHLYVGDTQQNMRDKKNRGRAASGDQNGARLWPETRPRGMANRKSKMTDTQVREVRARHSAGGVTLADLAKEYGITKSTMTRIVSGRYWSQIPMEGEYRKPERMREEDIVEIREKHFSGEWTVDYISKKFNLSGTFIRFVLRGHKWKNAGGPVVETLTKR